MLNLRSDNKRKEFLAVRVTATERRALEVVGQRLGLSVSDLTRQAINCYLATVSQENVEAGDAQPTQN